MSSIEPAMARQFEHLPPHDLDAERCVLGSMILAGADVRIGIRATITGADFFQADHQIIFEAMCRIIDAGRDVDGKTLQSELIRLGTWEEIGGGATLATVLNTVPSGAHGRTYAEAVRERSKKRQVIALSNDLLRQAYGGDSDYTGDDLLASASKRITNLMAGRRDTYWKIGDMLSKVGDQLDRGGVELVPTGIQSIDDVTGGIGLGENVILAARPSMGKSTALRQILIRAAKAGTPTGIISLEEGGLKIGRNVLAAECGIENNKIRKADLAQEEWNELVGGVGRLSVLPVYGSDTVRRLQDIKSLVTTWVTRHGVKLIVLDYLQRVQVQGLKEGYERVSYVSRELADLWKEMNVAAIVAAQLNRGVEGRDNKRPIMSDLRDSGGIEQDADGIIFLHREDYFHVDEPDYEPTGVAEFIISKWRDGVRGGVVRMRSNLRYQCFEDLPPEARSVGAKVATKSPVRGGKPAPVEWKPEAFVERFILEEPQSEAVIIEAACGQGLQERRVKRLLTVVVEKGLAYRWDAADQTKPVRYCRRKETLIDSAKVHRANPPTYDQAKKLASRIAKLFPSQVTEEQFRLAIKNFQKFSASTVDAAITQHYENGKLLDLPTLFITCEIREAERLGEPK